MSAFDQAGTILDSNSEEAWGETNMHPREWELGSIFPHHLPTKFSQVYMVANLQPRALKKTPALQARVSQSKRCPLFKMSGKCELNVCANIP